MKKKMLLVLLSILTVLLAGCGHFEQNIVVNEDGSGTLELIEAFLQEEDFGEFKKAENFTDMDFSKNEMYGIELIGAKPYEKMKDDGLYVGMQSKYKIENIADVEGLKVVEKENTVYIEINNNDTDVNNEAVAIDTGLTEFQDELLEHLTFICTMKLPGEIVKTNGKIDEVNGLVSWNVKEFEKGEDKIFVEYEKTAKKTNNKISEEAEKLKELGLLKGTEKGLELNKSLTRAEGAVMIKRIQNITDNSFSKQTNKEPKWKDVPNWAKEDVFSLGREGIISGVSEDIFAPNKEMKAIDFTTMILRMLDYSDLDGDFTWETSLEKAVDVGLITLTEKENIKKKQFTRDDMALISYRAIMFKTN